MTTAANSHSQYCGYQRLQPFAMRLRDHDVVCLHHDRSEQQCRDEHPEHEIVQDILELVKHGQSRHTAERSRIRGVNGVGSERGRRLPESAVIDARALYTSACSPGSTTLASDGVGALGPSHASPPSGFLVPEGFA
jgi:hypothetical protein